MSFERCRFGFPKITVIMIYYTTIIITYELLVQFIVVAECIPAVPRHSNFNTIAVLKRNRSCSSLPMVYYCDVHRRDWYFGKTVKTLGGNDLCNGLYTILLSANTGVDVIHDLCKSILQLIQPTVYNSRNIIVFIIKCIILGENYDEPEYVKSTMTNRPYPHVIKRPLSAFDVFFFF